MVRVGTSIAVTVWLLAGCANMQAPTTPGPAVSEKERCTRGGGWWRESLGVCDTQGTGPEQGSK